MRVRGAVGFLLAGIFGLATLELVTLAIAGVALALAVASLLQGRENRKDLKLLASKQNVRASELVEGLEDDLAGGD
jgi:membrane protein implicated in regulation of membrane protease activity